MIEPDALLAHARRLAGEGRGRPPEVDLRRGVSAAYYAVFHDITARASKHLIGSAPSEARDAVRRTWSHGEIATAAEAIVRRAATLSKNPTAALERDLAKWGPLVDICARNAPLVEALRLFGELQEQRHRADYEHGVRFDKLSPLTACQDAKLARDQMDAASAAAREAFFTLLTVQRSDFRHR